MKSKGKAVAVARGNVSRESRTAVQRLKPERVQDGLAVRKARQRLKVMQRLDGMTGWKLSPTGRTIGKVRDIADPQHAAAYAAFALQLAAGRRLPLGLTLANGQLVVTLHSRSGHGITGSILDLATELG